MRRAGRRSLLFATWVVIGTLGGLFLAVGLPNLFDAKSLTVMSGSMQPTINTGDVIVVRQTSPMLVRVGDIVTFRDPLNHARLITHRVREMHIQGDQVLFVTKGDANSSTEQWVVARSGTIGRVAFHIPLLGFLMVWIHSSFGLMLVIVIPTLLLGASELWRIWRPRGAHELGSRRDPADRGSRAGRRDRRVPDEAVA
jgi:signal peptidase I